MYGKDTSWRENMIKFLADSALKLTFNALLPQRLQLTHTTFLQYFWACLGYIIRLSDQFFTSSMVCNLAISVFLHQFHTYSSDYLLVFWHYSTVLLYTLQNLLAYAQSWNGLVSLFQSLPSPSYPPAVLTQSSLLQVHSMLTSLLVIYIDLFKVSQML